MQEPTPVDGSSAATLATTLFHTLEKNVGKFLAALLITSVPIPLEIKVSLLPLLVGKIFFGSQCYVTEMLLIVLWVEINNRALEGRSKVTCETLGGESTKCKYVEVVRALWRIRRGR